MYTWIALFRGINVGGNNSLPMKELIKVLEKIGCVEIKTYIQSGNVVLRSKISNAEKLSKQIEKAILDQFGFLPRVILLSRKELEKTVAQNPFKKAQAGHKTLHFFFLSSVPKKPDLKSLNEIKTANESFAIRGKTFYLHAKDGIGKSKLAARAEKLLGVDATGRNWNTVMKLTELVQT